MALGAGAQDATTTEQQHARRKAFRSQYMFHKVQDDGTSKLDKKRLLEVVRSLRSLLHLA